MDKHNEGIAKLHYLPLASMRHGIKTLMYVDI